jgi:membrane protein
VISGITNDVTTSAVSQPVDTRANALRRAARFVIAVAWRFYDDQCLTRASALAYTALLSLVPLMALMFAVLKGLGVQHRLEPLLLSRLSLDQTTSDLIIEYVDRTNVSTLGALGAAMLVVTVISVLGTIESSFNSIWRVTQPRSLWRQVTDYLGVVLLSPMLMLAGVALTSAAQVQTILQWILGISYIGDMARRVLSLTPILINAAGLGVLYAVMPNRRPAWKPIVVSALVAGILWQLVQWTYVRLQVGVARNDAIYGALAQLPVTLVWLYVSWVIVLVGAEIAAVLEFGVEARQSPRDVPDAQGIALHLLLLAGDDFARGGPGVEPRVVARRMGIRIDAMQPVAIALQELGWLVAIDAHPERLVLARAPATLELTGLTRLVRGEWVPPRIDPRAKAALARAESKRGELWEGRTLADVIGQAPRSAEVRAAPQRKKRDA